MALIKQYHEDTKTTYVYSSESYWDPVKKQSRSKRKVVGKIDPDTGEIVPTGKRGRKKKPVPTTENNAGDSRLSDLYDQSLRTITAKEQTISDLKEDVKALKKEISLLKEQNRTIKSALQKINSISGGILE